MAGKIFWENQFNQMREGKEPALTIDQEQEREKPQIQLEDINAPVKQDLSLQAADQGVGVTDVAKAAASGGVGWAESTAEILTEPQFRKTVSTTVPGMILSLSDYVPLIRDKMTEARRGGQEALGQTKKSIRESMSEPAKKAIEAELVNDNLDFTDDAAKLSTWIMKGTETIARMVPDLVAGGLVGKGLYNSTYETAYKAGIAKGLTEQGAKVAANKIAGAAVSVPTAFMATTSATGGAGVQAREAIESLPWSDLQKSEIFVNNFKSIDADPANESMSDQQKLSLARTLTAEHASSKIMQDPALLTVNALSSFIGDATLGRMIAGKIGGGIVNKAVRGFAAEAPTEAAQSAAEQYAQNLILIDVAGQDVDPMKGVKRAAAEGGLLGGAVGGTVGGTVGAVDKVTGRESQPLEPQLDGPEIIPEEVATIADGDLKPGAAPEPLTVAERRAALNEKLAAQQEQLRRERVLAGTGEVQEALSKGQTAPTPIELIAQAKEQAKVQRDEFVEGRAAPTVAERRANLKRRLEQQSAEYAKQQAEAGKGPVQERLSMPTSPTVDELLIKASTETGPSPYELEYRKQAERDYIEKVKDAAIPQGLKGKPNAVKLLNKGYRNAIADFGGLSEQLSKTTYPDPKTDTMAEVIGKMGGIGRATAESEGFDPAMFKGSKTFSANGKMTFDDAAEKLNELGYRNRQGDTLDSNDVVDMLYGEINNTENHYSTHVDPKMLTADAQIVRTWAKALGGADKLSATTKKSLAGERLGKRQAEVMEDMLDSIAAMRSEGAEQAKQTLDARRSEREAKRIESFNSLMAEATGNKSHIADIDSYNRMLSEKPEYYSEEQVILDELVATAGDIDFNATSEAIDLYESGKTSLPNLLTKLSDIANKRERTYAEAKPAIQAVSKPTTQPIEGVVTERVAEIEGAPAAETAGPKPIKPEEKEPEKVIADKTDLAKQRDRRHAELEVKQAEGLVLETQQKIEQQKATGGRTDILNSNLQRQISGANRIRAKYGLGPMKVETKPAAVEVSGAEKAKVVNASSHKTVRDKVLAWADIKFGDTIIDHRGAFIGVAVADFDSKKPRAIKIRKSDGTTELYNFKSILGSDVEVMSIDAIGRIKGREELDSAATVMAESRPEKAPEVGTTLDETTEQQNRRILDAVKADIVKGFSPKSNNDLKIIGLKVFGLDKSAQVDNNKLKLLQEAFETVEAQKRREAINRMLTVVKPEDMALKTAYSEAVSSYESQPNLDVRTAKSSDMQAYSTPTPMALLANIAAGVDSSTTVYEPTAGNGLLLMTANPKNTIANELDPVRASSLAWSGFDVTVSDATSNNIGTKVDAVLANPPFGKMPDGSVVVFDDYQGRKVTLKEIDHVIARNALEAMSDNGKATLIIGANMKEPGVYKGNQKAFLNFVYSNYNVAHHVEVDGTLYKGQGAGFPTQMIVIHGRVRGGTGKFAPISGVVKRINSWSELYENFKDAGLLDTKGQRFDGRAKSDGVVSSNTGKTELRGGVPEHTVESRISDIEAKREADNGLSKPTKLARSKSADIGKPTDGTVTSQPDISGTGLVGSPSVLSGKSISDKPVGQVKPVRLSVDETVEAKKPNTKTAPRQIDTKVDKANAFQAHYKTASNGFNEGVLTPNNMASYTQSALADLQERHGSVDKFVIDKLGYDSPEEMHAAFMGLQADAIALAIDNIENGRAIVIGDQTGVGKGRQAAGIIRYAMKKGKVPIFISQKPNLFTDMYDDLADIGVQSFKPLIMNDDKGYVSKGGEKLFNHTPAKRKELLNQITSSGLPEGYNGLFLTYSQIASDSKGFKTGLLNMLAENSLIIMDESHSAAGDSKTGLVFQDLVNKAFGVTYLSATYAKRPDNMMLYMRTDLGLATEDRQSLLDSVNAGGLGMQTYIAGKLAEAGQMVRRERSFDGISINNKVIDDKSGSTAKSFDKATKVLRTIQDLSSYWAAYVESELADYIQMKHGLDTAVGGNKADKNINVTSFSSIVHNNIAQLSLSLKAREIGRMAIDSIKDGKRPVIALDNTLGSALQSYMSDNGLSVGDKARDMTYATVIRNALDGVLSYTVKVPGETKGVSVKMPISQINSPIIKDLYDKAVSEIKDLATEGIPGSPIDAIRHEITKAGFTVSEITGRNVMIDYSNNNQIVTRPADEMDRRAVVDKFNSGSLDVLILNQAGSTGLSIHASEKFADTKPRHMIVAQPSLDINTYMQMLGRVNRTGQVALPSYDNVWLNLPSEKRPAAVLSRKMSSLNANTSGNTESATSVESVDMLNQYGDQVVKAFVDANGDYLSQFSPKLVDIPDVDSAVYFLGKLAVLPVSVQEEVMSVVESEYVDLINYLDSTGQNDLNMTEIDLDAKPISQKKLAEGRKEAGVFSDPVYLTKVDAKATGKAPTWSQVKEALSLTSQADFDNAITIASNDTEFESRLNQKLKDLESRKSDLISKDKDIETIRKAIDEQLVRISDYESSASEVRNLFGKGGIYSHGSYINVVMSEGDTAIPGVIVGIDYKHEKGNPYSSSKWKMKIMVADRIAKIDIPLSLAKKGSVQGKRWDNERTMESRFNLEADKPARESRYVMTGNLVEAQALSHVKGQIKPITLNDGRIIQAMVLPRSFDAVDDVSQKLSVSHAQASKWLAETDRDLGLMGLSNKSGDVTIRRHWKNDGSYVFEMPKSVSKGKQYWGNPAIEKVIGKQAVKGAGSLEVILNEQEMKRIVKVMDEISPLGIRNQAQISDYNKRSGKKENDFDTKGIKFSQSKQTDTPEFKRWFGDSKVVDENGDPIVVYHGSGSKFTTFDKEMSGSFTGAESAKKGFFFTSSNTLAESFATEAQKQKVNFNDIKLSIEKLPDNEFDDLYQSLGLDNYFGEMQYMDSQEVADARSQAVSYIIESIENDATAYPDDRSNYSRSLKKYINPDLFNVGEVKGVYLKINDPLIVNFKDEYQDSAITSSIDKAIKNGNDGVIFKGMMDAAALTDKGSGYIKSDVYVTFEPNQIKSATGNVGTFDPENANINFSSDSIVTGKPKGMPIKEVDIVAKSFIKEYKGAAGIKSVVFKTQKEAMDYAGIQDDESVLRNAFYNPRTNEVVLIADNINGAADARKILRHEILAHHGLMRVVGQEEWQSIVNLVSASREAKSLKDIWADIDSRYEGFDENTKAEEVIANISEIEPSKLGEWGNRIIAAITRALRKAGLIGDKITATEIKDMIRIIGERIKTVSAGRAEIKNDIRFSQGQLTAKDGFSIPDETRKDAFIRSIQDKYRRLKVTQKAVKEQGGMIDENKDVYLAEELFHGKVGEDLRVMEDQFIKPLVEYMGKENVSREELDLYLIARHAPERNAQIAKINPDIQDGGSGMTDAEAAKVMDNFIKEGTIAKMQKAASFVDGIINTTKQRLIDSGLESQDVVDSWDATYKHYVPLKGFAVNESDADGNRIKTTGKGFSVHGKETMRAMGRRTVSESPLAYVISDATQSAIRSRKNEVAQTMLRLVDANPDPELWQVFSSENPDTTRKITKRKDPVTGKTIETVIETVMPMHAMKDKYLGAKMNGEQYYIKLHDPRLMEAMANLGVEQANILTKTVGRVTRVLSALITSYNPEFALSNFARDVQTAVYNVLAEAKIEGGKALGTKDLAKKMVKDLPNSMKALKRGFRDNDFTGEWGVFLKEYLDSGAKTGWFVQKDIDDIKNDITRSISTTGEGAVNKLIRSKDKLIKFIDDYNDVVENASRLSVYVNARRQGLTEKAAASLAKNLTVNFNRRGEMTNSINALYMFFNASVQGTANMLRAVMTPADKTKKIWDHEFYNMTQKLAMALPIATILMAQANREWGGDDDDGKSFYDKVPNYVKETNFVLMIPGSEGDFIKIPMPYGYNFFASIGHAIDRGMNTESTAVESAFDAVAAFAGAFSPLGAVGSEEMTSQVVKTAAPAILKPFVEMALNENFTGAPIYKEQNPFGLKTPDAYNSQRKTWEWAKGLSEYLNDVTGGNQFKSGVVDIAPESWQHLIKFAGGGLGSLFGRAQDLAVKTARGENVESREIPFWRKYMGSISESVDISEMYKRFDEIKTVEKQATMLPGQERIKFITENRPKVKLIAMAKGMQTELTKLNKQKAAIDASKLSDEQKQLRIEAIENRRRLMAAKFNKAYNESVK